MGSVTVYDAARMKQIEDTTIVAGEVDSGGNLVLTSRNGVEFDAGHVRGEDATALLTVEDSSTIDLTLGGSGTPASPWLFKADVKRDDVETVTLKLGAVDSTGVRWYVMGSDGISYGPFRKNRNLVPIPGDTVWVIKDGFGSYIIDGSVSDWKPLPLTSRAVSYNANNASDEWFYPEYTVRNGFVILRGLLATIAGGGIIATLPSDARPDSDILLTINNTMVARSLYVRTDGGLGSTVSTTANGYFSLDGLMFPVAGRATWTRVGDPGSGLAFANGWGEYQAGTTQYGKVGFWKDEYDFIWMRGLIAGGSVTDNTAMVNITNPDFKPWDNSPAATQGEQHLLTNSADQIGGLNIYGHPTLTSSVRAGSAVANNTAWISLAGQCYMSNSAFNHPDWIIHPDRRVYGSGWSSSGTLYPRFAYRQRLDGIVMTRGLIAGGTFSSSIDYLPESYRSERTLLLSTVTNGVLGRVDVRGRQNASSLLGSGAMSITSGSATWFSLDMLKWLPG